MVLASGNIDFIDLRFEVDVVFGWSQLFYSSRVCEIKEAKIPLRYSSICELAIKFDCKKFNQWQTNLEPAKFLNPKPSS